MRRTRYLLLGAALVLAGLIAWMLTVVDEPRIPSAQPAPHYPDYYLDHFAATTMDAKGLPHYRLQAIRLEHYPDDGSVALTAPHVTLYRAPLPPWQATSDHGVVPASREVIELSGDVVIWREEAAPAQDIKVVTRDVVVYLDEERAETAAPVLILAGPNRIESVGMQLHLQEGRLDLLSEVHGIYELPRN